MVINLVKKSIFIHRNQRAPIKYSAIFKHKKWFFSMLD